MTEPETREFEQRWTAWQKRGIAQDLIARQHLMIAVPVLACLALGATWFLQ